jgi:hypothetical protein
MWIIESAIGKNVGSYREVEYNVLQNNTVSIVGENKDDIGQESNGSGKSWLLEVFAIGLIGASLKKVRNIDLIRTGAKKMEVDIVLSNQFLKRKLIIKRVFPQKGSATLKIFLNDKDQSDKFPGAKGEQFILDQIGISKEDLLGYYLISKTRYKSYLSASDTIKKEVISRFSGADLLEGIDKVVQVEVDLIENKRKKIEDEKLKLEAKIEVYESDLKAEEDADFEADKSARVEGVEEKISNHNVQIKEHFKMQGAHLKAAERHQVRRRELSKQLLLIGSVEDKERVFNEIGEVIKGFLNEIELVETQISDRKDTKKEYIEFKNSIETSIKGSVKCPKCMHEFSVVGDDIDIEAAKKMVPTIENNILNCDIDINNFETGKQLIVGKGKVKRDEQKVVSKEIEDVRKKEHTYKREIGNCDLESEASKRRAKAEAQSITLKEGSIDQFKKQIEEIKAEERKSREAELNKSIKKAQNDIIAIDKKVVGLNDEAFKEAEWIYNFKKFNSHLAVKALKTIEGRMNVVLQGFDSDLRVELEGFKMLSTGEVREKIATHVWRDDGERGVLEKFSAGEKARVEVSAIVALQGLINQSAESGGLNFLMIDEILESVDAFGIEIILNSLNNIDRTVMLVTHVGTDSINYEHVLLAVKEGGETKLFVK